MWADELPSERRPLWTLQAFYLTVWMSSFNWRCSKDVWELKAIANSLESTSLKWKSSSFLIIELRSFRQCHLDGNFYLATCNSIKTASSPLSSVFQVGNFVGKQAFSEKYFAARYEIDFQSLRSLEVQWTMIKVGIFSAKENFSN